MSIGKDFDRSIAYYDAWIEMALHCYQDVFSIAQNLIPFDPGAPIRVLDLGAGTGLFSRFVLERYPQATFVLYDLGKKMLAKAEERFRDTWDQFESVVGDYREIAYQQAFDLVVSSLSIHHLTDPDKADLDRRIYAALKPGGVFINIDQVRGESEYVRQLYWNGWLDRVRASGASAEQIEESITRRTTYDKDALLCDQIQWLREARFESADCVYKHHFIGLFFARKSEET